MTQKATTTGRPAARRRSAGRTVLPVVIVFLAGSGLVRLATGPGQGWALDLANLVRAATAAPSPDEAAAGTCAPAPEIAAVLDALGTREARLAEWEAALADRRSALDLAAAEVAENIAALQAAEDRLSRLVALSETAAEGDLSRLTAVYESMKPKEAAALFEEMSPDFAAGFIGRMRPERAAEIMAGLAPETAYTVSVILAGRNANAPTE